jgi:hypothetical protein
MNNLNRRIFLRGLGGAVIAAPFLSSLFERSAKAKVAVPIRTILMFTHYGCVTNKWFPAKLDGELTADDLAPTSLAPLAPFAKKLLMPRGIRTMNEWTHNNKGPGHGRGQGNDIHLQAVGSLLTCQPVTPNSDDPFSFNSGMKFNAMPIGPSLDHVIARQLSPKGEPLLLSPSGRLKEGAQSALSYSDRELKFDATNVTDAFASLTGLFKPNAPMNGDTWAVAKGKAITDIVKADLSRLRNRDMSKADKEKLAAWMELANQVGKTVSASAQCNQELAMKLHASDPLASGTTDVLTRQVNDSMDNADLYSAIATLTAACNANPVIVLKYPPSFIFTGLGITQDSDLLAHRTSDAGMQGPCAPKAVENLLKIDGYYAQKFANLVGMLDSISEGEQTLLDNSVVLWMSDASDGCARNLNNSPIIQAGSAGGYFKTGKIVHLDAASGATAEQMLGRSLATCVDGTSQQTDGLNQVTGTEPQYGNAPVNKYFCNIMNAMGLKADANGYPAVNGPGSEVLRFGYSDKTEDFCGGEGAVQGATIHDPGGFSALEA